MIETGLPKDVRVHRALFPPLPSLARRDLTGGADLGARPPAAGSLHRAGCEDGRAGQRQDPFISSLFSFLAGVPIRARVGRLSERDQSAVGLPLLLSCNGCRRQ